MLLLLWLAAAQQSPEDLVARLAAEAVEEREAAEQALLALGPSALPAVERARVPADPEAALRLRRVVGGLRNRAAFSPLLLREFPGLDLRLADGPDAAWTRAFFDAAARGLAGADVDALALRALRGAAGPDEQRRAGGLIENLRCRSAAPEIARGLSDPNPAGRAEAIRRLRRFEARERLPDLLPLLRDPDPAVRHAAGIAAAAWDAADAWPVVLDVLRSSSDAETRRQAGDVLLAAKARQFVPDLHAMLREPSKGVHDVLRVLAEFRDPSSIEEARGLLRRPDPPSRISGIRLAQDLGATALGEDIAALLSDRTDAVYESALRALPKLDARAALPAVRGLLAEAVGYQRRREAARALAAFRDREAVPALLRATEDGNFDVRVAAVEALGDLGPVEALPVLLAKLDIRHPAWNESIFRLVAKAGPDAALKPLSSLLGHAEPAFRKEAVFQLRRLGTPGAEAALAGSLSEPDGGVLAAILYALAEMEVTPALAEAIVPLLKDGRPGVAQAAERVRKQAEARAATARAQAEFRAWAELDRFGAEPAGPELVARLRDPAAQVRYKAGRMIEQNPGPGARPALRALLRDENPTVRAAAAGVLENLHAAEAVEELRLLLDDARTRAAAVSALGHLQDRGSMDAIRRALEDPEEAVRIVAIRAAGQLEAKDLAPALLERLRSGSAEERRMASYAVGLLRPDGAIAALAPLLKMPEPLDRIRGVQALEEIGGPEAVRLLLPLLDEPDASERRRAFEAPTRIPTPRDLAVAALCRLGVEEGIEANLQGLERHRSASLFHLNARRQPALWARLAALPSRTWKPGDDARKLLDALAREAGLPLVEEKLAVPLPRVGRVLDFHDCRPRRGGFLDQLDWAAGRLDAGAVLEADRLRLVPLVTVSEEWSRWGRERTK